MKKQLRYWTHTLSLVILLLCTHNNSFARQIQPVIRHVVPTSTPVSNKYQKVTRYYNLGEAGEDQSLGVPSALFDADNISWASFRDATSSAFSDHFAEMKDDNLMVDIEVDVAGRSTEVAAVWQKNFDNRGWAELRNLTHEQYSNEWNAFKDKGYRVIDQESYVIGGTRYYAGVWIENTEGLAWASFRDATSEDFSASLKRYLDLGYIIVDVEAYPYDNGNELRYAAVWVENAENLDWIELRGLTSAGFSENFKKYQNTHRMIDVESYAFNNVQYYAGIWVENKNNRGWLENRDMTASEYRNRWYRYRDLGYRLINFEKYETTGGEFNYAGIWRQNNDRRDWLLKDDVDDRVKTELDDFDVPGVGAAISLGGEIQYMRGFGFSDVADDVWYSSRTVNRLASISKAVGGVLALRLQEQGLIDIDTETRDYEPSLPASQSHTIRELLANRGGVGHYPELGSNSSSYNNALDGVQFFINEPLVYAPGTGCKYTTHGSSLPATAYEAVLGNTIFEIVEDELTNPLGLPTLQAEDRDEATIDWAATYATDNTEIASPAPLDWKTLGGGMVASPYDLLRFGANLIEGEILSEASLTELWTVPSPGCSSYALGWNIDTDQSAVVYHKDGNQTGARTYIRIYPEIEAVIVVMFNRDGGGHSPIKVGEDIGTLLLDAYFTATSNETEAPATDFTLQPAYPNPFQQETTLTLGLAEATTVQVSVYDLLGRRVALLKEGHVQAGTHSITWDGKSDAGASQAAGVYLIQMNTESSQVSRRVVLTH